MASVISAGTTAGTAVAIAGDTSGNLEFKTQAGTYTQTVPNATGTVMVSGNMPAFSAYPSSAQTLTGNVLTKILFQTEEFDTNSNFASSTFTPTVAGYYQINSAIEINSTACSIVIRVYKNGSLWKTTNNQYNASISQLAGSCLVYCNGTTDYVEIYAQISTGQALVATASSTYFQASMIRSA
jgi:hypothetical protein